MVFFANRRAMVPEIMLVIWSIEQFQELYGNSKVISNRPYENDNSDTTTTKGNKTSIVTQNRQDESASIISQKSTDESGLISLQNYIAEKAQDMQQVRKHSVTSGITVRNGRVMSESQTRNDSVAQTTTQTRKDSVAQTTTQTRKNSEAQTTTQTRKDSVAQTTTQTRKDSVAQTTTQTRKDSVAQTTTQSENGKAALDITKTRTTQISSVKIQRKQSRTTQISTVKIQSKQPRTTQISSVKIQRKQSRTISQGQHIESNRDNTTIKLFTNTTQFDSEDTQKSTVFPGHLARTTPSNESTFPYTDNITCSEIYNSSHYWIFNSTNSTCPNKTYDNNTLNYDMYIYIIFTNIDTSKFIFKSATHFAIGITGLIGNSLTLITLYKSDAEYSTTSFLFTSLSISDISANIILLIEIVCVDFLGFQSFLDMLNLIGELKPFLSNYILALVTLSRCVSVRCPFTVKTICSLTVSVSAVVTVTIFYIAYLFIFIFYIQYIEFKTVNSLVLYLSFKTLLIVGIPCLIIITCNVIIIQQLYQAYKRRRTMASTSADGHEREITITVVHITLVFVLLTIPYHISRINTLLLHIASVDSDTIDSNDIIINQAIEDMAYNYQEVNFSVNFFIYILNGSKFRKTLFSWFKRKQSIKTQVTSLTRLTVKTV